MPDKGQNPVSGTGDATDNPKDTLPSNTEAHQDDPRPAYFVAGEIVLQAEHPAGADLSAWANTLWKLDKRRSAFEFEVKPIIVLENKPPVESSAATDQPKRPQSPLNFNTFEDKRPIQSFAATDQPKRPQSLLKLNVKQPLQNDADLIEFVKDLNKTDPIDDIKLQAAMPNWCLTGCTHAIGHVGPGAHPRPPKKEQLHPNRHKFPRNKLDDIMDNLSSAAPTAGVNVVIFDTAPRREALDAAYDKKEFKDNDLLQKLCKNERDENNKTFTIKYASELGIDLPANLTETNGEKEGYAQKDEYNMSDHGLFIAGTIRSICDTANIYLVQTQNDFGIGTISSLAQGIKALIGGDVIPANKMNFPLVVNCSLCIEFENLPELKDNLNLDVSEVDIQAELKGVDIETVRELVSLYTPLKQLQDYFSKTGIHIIAAAGNDALAPSEVRALHAKTVAATGNSGPALTDAQIQAAYDPPPARYPAAFDFVFGVGSILKTSTRGWYSNKADVPPREGIMVFGGRADKPGDKHITNDQGDGMLGLYIGDFPPDQTPSEYGWAWWSGTSFATGVMSGYFALAAAKGIADFRQAIENRAEGTTKRDEPYIKNATRSLKPVVNIKMDEGADYAPSLFLEIRFYRYKKFNLFAQVGNQPQREPGQQTHQHRRAR